jgi:hypothetical protein
VGDSAHDPAADRRTMGEDRGRIGDVFDLVGEWMQMR